MPSVEVSHEDKARIKDMRRKNELAPPAKSKRGGERMYESYGSVINRLLNFWNENHKDGAV